MSTSASVGLAGVSTITRPVSGRIASAMPSGSTKVTSVPSSPAFRRWSLHPYSGRTATTWRRPSLARARSTALSAAMPLAKATALSAPSSRASPSSKRAVVGLSSRAYTGGPSGRAPVAANSSILAASPRLSDDG
ncbi:hypothetical protein BGM19_07140 [Streptomyces agglomeratus]|nr:hypothetical protein BGM19_07140 [Streptomyces agglomeratus]